MKPSTEETPETPSCQRGPRGNVRETLVVDDHLKRTCGNCLAHALKDFSSNSFEVQLFRWPMQLQMAVSGVAVARGAHREARTSNNAGKKTHSPWVGGEISREGRRFAMRTRPREARERAVYRICVGEPVALFLIAVLRVCSKVLCGAPAACAACSDCASAYLDESRISAGVLHRCSAANADPVRMCKAPPLSIAAALKQHRRGSKALLLETPTRQILNLMAQPATRRGSHQT